MSRCKYYKAIEQNVRENCPNCQRWNGKRCIDEKLVREAYLDSNEFKFFDRLMRGNKGVQGPL